MLRTMSESGSRAALDALLDVPRFIVVEMRTPMLACVVAAVFVVGCGAHKASRVSDAERRALPTEQLTLGNDLCLEESDALDLARREVRRRRAKGRRELVALEAAYASHPDAVVKTTYLSSDEGPGTEDITIRQLVRGHLAGVTEEGISGSACFKQVAARLRRLLAR